tara:strand:- start:681 stop:1790 length:1110 start_codon:yes stop_codon:yes gene_type:complete
MLFFIIINIIVLLLYTFKIISFRIGWDRLITTKKNEYYPNVSIIVSLRNEESNVNRLVNELKKQIYPKDKLEFIFVNDHSTDMTFNLLKKIEIDNFKLVNMADGEFGKKAALTRAVVSAKGEIILVTDADCHFSIDWIRTMVSNFVNEKIKLVSGPVIFNKENGNFKNLQALEFASLVGSGAGAIGIGNPIFCNGANMAYRKKIFLELNNFKNDNAFSGDDVFLLHSVKQKYPKSVAFVKDSNAIVNTSSASNLSAFINQRKRWTAKSSKYKDIESIYVSFLVLFANLLVILLLLGSLFFQNYYYFALYLVIKFLVDLFLLYPVLKFFNREDLIKWILPFELFYSFYIILIVSLSFTNSFEWKGRILKK